jgi:hypothetical protein
MLTRFAATVALRTPLRQPVRGGEVAPPSAEKNREESGWTLRNSR